MIDYIVQTVKKIYIFLFIRKQPIVVVPVKKKRQRKQKIEGEWTLKEMLEGLEKTHEWISKNVCKGSWIEKDIVNAAKRLSVYNVNNGLGFNTEFYDHVEYGYPTTGVLALNGEDYTSETGEAMIREKAIIFLKLHQFPWGIEQIEGVKYIFGAAREYKDQIYYDCVYVAFDNDGKCLIPKQHRTATRFVGKARGAGKGSCKFAHSYECHVYGDQPIFQNIAADAKEKMIKNFGSIKKSTIVMCNFALNAYMDRGAHWNITTEKGGQRVCFKVSNDNVITFFKDRMKLDTTPSGRRRTILHCVRSHIRRTGSLVKMHLRGASNFYWKGYRCAIFAPGWHGKSATEFQADTYAPNETSKKTLDLEPASQKIGDHFMNPVKLR